MTDPKFERFLYVFRYPDNATLSVYAVSDADAWAAVPGYHPQGGPRLESKVALPPTSQHASDVALQILMEDRDRLRARVDELTADLSAARCDKATLDGACKAVVARNHELEDGSERLKLRVAALEGEVLAQSETERHLQERIAFWKRQAGGLE